MLKRSGCHETQWAGSRVACSTLVFSGGYRGEGGGGRGEQTEPTAASHSEGLSPAQPQLSQQTASCAQLPEDAGTHLLATRLHLFLVWPR